MAWLMFWPLALLTTLALALELGDWHTEFRIAGPFAAETDGPAASLKVHVPIPSWVRGPAGGNIASSFESAAGSRADGREMGPPHTGRETVGEASNTDFNASRSEFIFSLPEGVNNGPETVATLRYRLVPRWRLTLGLSAATALLGWFLFVRTFVRRYGRVLLIGTYHALAGCCCAGLAVAAVFVASSLYAWVNGWALPTTALLLWSPHAAWAARNEPYLGYLLLTLAGAATVCTWLTASTARGRALTNRAELAMQKLLFCCGFPVAACAFVLCVSAMWAGIARPGDFHFANIGGLVPFSDASDYLSSAFDQIRDGMMSDMALRRPLAAGFRSVLLIFGNFSLPLTLILQACLLAGAVCAATWSIVAWRGVWAGTTFFALSYIYDRIFVPTTLTEPLGLFWALLSIPFFVEAFRHRSVDAALMAFAMTTVALMTRMGSMFTIPALLVWLVWQFGNSTAAKLRIGVAGAAVLLGVLGLNSLLLKEYGTAQSSTGSNFSHVLCGLTMGTDWQGCPAKLAGEGIPLQSNEAAAADQLYSMALGNFRARPDILFRRLGQNLKKFVSDFPDVMWRGHLAAVAHPPWLFRSTLTVISLIGLAYVAARGSGSVEIVFWGLFWASIAASSSLIYYDDGSRVLAASHPLMAMFFAMGMSNPGLTPAASLPRSRLSHWGFAGLIVAALLFVGLPWAAHRSSSVPTLAAMAPAEKPDEALVLGGRRMSGFLVVRDDVPLRHDVPSLHLSEFNTILELSGLEFYQNLMQPEVPPLPFGFVFAPRVPAGSVSGYLYIVPPEVLQRRNVQAWHFDLKHWGYKPGGFGEYWFYVTKARPWP